MSSPHIEFSRRAVRWLLPAALLGLTPKCVMCVVAYAGLGAAIGLEAPELCGASAAPRYSWMSSLAWLGAGTLGMTGFLASCRRVRCQIGSAFLWTKSESHGARELSLIGVERKKRTRFEHACRRHVQNLERSMAPIQRVQLR